MERLITIKNCNCIKFAEIAINDGQLNIKYGPNGTGKSTISEAIFSKSQNDTSRLADLKPYNSTAEEIPEVDGLSYTKIRVFDENYMDQYLFRGNSLFEDSFQVFLRSPDCDSLISQIDALLGNLQNIFQSDENICDLKEFLPKYFSTIKTNNDGKIKKAGGVSELINGNGAGFQKHSELDAYKPYYENRLMTEVAKWAKWRNEGINETIENTCPFCTHPLDNTIEQQNKTISTVFKNSALATASAVITFVTEAVQKKYMHESAKESLENIIGDSSKSDELCALLQQIHIETDYLNKKIDKILLFRPMVVTKDELDHIETSLEDLRIEERYISQYYSTDFIKNIVYTVNSKIDELKTNVGKLKGLFIQHDLRLEKIIKEREQDIDDFFSLAGFPYKFVLEKDGENRANAYLKPIDNQGISVSSPRERLSWGERNAFSLVMFMFEAISDGADLIVLDDPISSFDENKKFAIVRRLFDNHKPSFRDKTVLMLTHDMQPLIDYVHGNFFSRLGITTPVNARLIQNNNGIIEEFEIGSSDLLNVVQLTQEIAKDSQESLPVRIVNLRKFTEITKPDATSLAVYDVLSNLIHGRATPINKEGQILDQATLSNGMSEISSYIPGYTYASLCAELTNDKLLSHITISSGYEKVIAIRFVLERDEALRLRIRREYPGVSKFFNESNHIENDYIFQLDPRKFCCIPTHYISTLEALINENH